MTFILLLVLNNICLDFCKDSLMMRIGWLTRLILIQF